MVPSHAIKEKPKTGWRSYPASYYAAVSSITLFWKEMKFPWVYTGENERRICFKISAELPG